MSASLLSQIQNLARYNRRANRVIYDACGVLLHQELVRDRAVPFQSILGTLNHILVIDRTWLDRFTQTDREPPKHNKILHDTLAELRAARDAEDERIMEFCETLKIAFLSSCFQYTDHYGVFRQDGADVLVLHFFNNQTHHRSQVHHMLVRSGATEQSLDLHRLLHP
jgi:uncharacterized damage-inducible protein DinB